MIYKSLIEFDVTRPIYTLVRSGFVINGQNLTIFLDIKTKISSSSGPNIGSFVNRPATLEMGGGPLNLRISPFKSSSNCVYTSASLARRRSSCVTANLANLNKDNC